MTARPSVRADSPEQGCGDGPPLAGCERQYGRGLPGPSRQTQRARWRCSSTDGTATSVSWEGKSGGWKPLEAMNGAIPVAEQTRELCAYSIHERCVDQEAGCRAVTHHRAAPRSWFARSVWPLVCGWYPDERLADAPNAWQNAFHVLAENCGPLSETMSTGMPCRQKTCMTSSNPAGAWWNALLRAQTEQAATNSLVSAAMEGHQNRCCRRASVGRHPGWQAIREACPHCRTGDLTTSGTNNLSGGQPCGTGWSLWAPWTTPSISHPAAPTTQADGRMVLPAVSSRGRANWRDSASGFMFFDPGRYVSVNWKRPRNNAHRAWRELSLRAERR